MSPTPSDVRISALPLACCLAWWLLAAAFSTPALAGDLRAYFDRKSVYEGDTVTLIIETTKGTLGQPDLSGISADFDLLGTSQSTNISIINGRRTDTVRLLVTLAPRHKGAIEVPPIQVGSERTQPLRLQVSEAPAGGTGGGGDDIFVELDVGTGAGGLMVQQQVPMTVRLFTAVPLLRGNLEDPRVEGAVVTQLGEDREYETRRNGRQYRVIERSYSLAPEHSGELRIPPVRFEGSVRTAQGRSGGSGGGLFGDPLFDRFFADHHFSPDPLGIFDRGEPVSARSRGATLDVQPRPGEYAGARWLPAEDLKIVDSWAESPPELRVGEPATRTLTLEAKGLSGAQIPEIEIPTTPGLRVYPDKTDGETRSDGKTLYGISRQGMTLIPTRAGKLMIPQIQVTWWDTRAGQERVATLPGRTLDVAGDGGASAQAEPAWSPDRSSAPASAARDETSAQDRQVVDKMSGVTTRLVRTDYLHLVLGLGLLALLLAGAWSWRYRRRRSGSARADARPAQRSMDRYRWGMRASRARDALRLACRRGDAKGAAKALLDWAQATWPESPPRNLGTLGARIGRGGDELRELERHLYAPANGPWDGTALWGKLKEGLSDAPGEGQGRGAVLAPLYPRRRSPPGRGGVPEQLGGAR